jgi:putrescine aminotransferase
MEVLADMSETGRWQELDRRHHLHPFTNNAELGRKGSRIIVAAEGCHLIDSEGHRILDGMAGLWCVNAGYGRARLVEAARRQMTALPYYNTFFQTATPPAVELAAALAGIAPAGLDRVFFTGSGSEANDTVIKLVWFFWNLMGQPEKKTFISREFAYHGVTIAAASLSGQWAMHPQHDLPLARFAHIGAPYHYADPDDLAPEAFAKKAAAELEAKILEIGADRVAAFIGEPIQGSGGVIIPPPGYWQQIQAICRKHDVLLVADEVITGFGRTGRWFGSETFGIEPDLMTIAKGVTSGYLPLGAVLIGPRVGDALLASGQEWFHGFTYSGHPVAAAVALENLALLREEGLHERASGPIGRYFADALASLGDHPLVGEIRSCGLIGALELVEDKAARRHFPPARQVGLTCREHCFASGLVMRAIRDIMVLSPPLIVTEAEIDEIVAKARRAFDLTARDLGL